jgi:hypothetical protein
MLGALSSDGKAHVLESVDEWLLEAATHGATRPPVDKQPMGQINHSES